VVSRDPMFQSDIYGNTSLSLRLTNLQTGTYTFYVYAHGKRDNYNSSVELRVAGVSKATNSTTSAVGWNKADWTEGSHYVRFANVTVTQGQEVQFISKPAQRVERRYSMGCKSFTRTCPPRRRSRHSRFRGRCRKARR
jgi:hypothetical protein